MEGTAISLLSTAEQVSSCADIQPPHCVAAHMWREGRARENLVRGQVGSLCILSV